MNCNKKKEIKSRLLTYGRGKYCSVKCANLMKDISNEKNPNWQGGKNIPCLICKKEFWIKPSHFNKRKTCSRICATKLKIESNQFVGKNNPAWIDGRTVISRGIRHSKEYRQWRKLILARDKVCIKCGSNKELQADHIKSFKTNPELIFDINNGRILCFDCHKKTDTYGSKNW